MKLPIPSPALAPKARSALDKLSALDKPSADSEPRAHRRPRAVPGTPPTLWAVAERGRAK